MSHCFESATIREAYLQASSFLKKNQTGQGQSPEQVAKLLLEYATGYTHNELLFHWNDPISSHSLSLMQEGLRRRAKGEPIQYILGEQEFYGYPFQVDPSVLIPRPETELLVETVLKAIQQNFPAQATVVAADIGTGSGAIAVTLAKRCPRLQVWATDLSKEALEVAKANGERHGVNDRIEWVHGHLLQPIIVNQTKLDVLVSNPPYIPTADLEGLQVEVKDYEPLKALDGGRDGLMFYRRMIEELAMLPTWPKLIAFEVGSGQAREVAQLLARAKDRFQIEIIADYAGIERHVMAMEKLA